MDNLAEKLQISFTNISDGYDVLLDEYRESQRILNSCISDLLNKNNEPELENFLELRKEIKGYVERIEKCRQLWNEVILTKYSTLKEIDEDISDYEEEDDNPSAVDRTSWKIVNNAVRVETIRPNNRPSYSNNIPIALFKETVLTIIEQFERYKKDTIKTSSIEALMRDKIVSESSYKKATKSFVYSVFKVLQKEGMLKPYENTKRIYTNNREYDFIKAWLSTEF